MYIYILGTSIEARQQHWGFQPKVTMNRVKKPTLCIYTIEGELLISRRIYFDVPLLKNFLASDDQSNHCTSEVRRAARMIAGQLIVDEKTNKIFIGFSLPPRDGGIVSYDLGRVHYQENLTLSQSSEREQHSSCCLVQ